MNCIQAWKAEFTASEIAACWQDLTRARGRSDFDVQEAWDTLQAIGKKPVVNTVKHGVLFTFYSVPGDAWMNVLLKEKVRYTRRCK